MHTIASYRQAVHGHADDFIGYTKCVHRRFETEGGKWLCVSRIFRTPATTIPIFCSLLAAAASGILYCDRS